MRKVRLDLQEQEMGSKVAAEAVAPCALEVTVRPSKGPGPLAPPTSDVHLDHHAARRPAMIRVTTHQVSHQLLMCN